MWLPQIVGAFIGAGILELIFMNRTDYQGNKIGAGAIGSNSCSSILGETGSANAIILGLIVEIVLTFIFVLAILGVTSKKEYSNVAGIVIGLTLTLVHLLGIPLTGTSVNPARSIGPAIVALANGQTEGAKELYIFILGPLAGAALAALLYNFLAAQKAAKENSEAK